MLKLEPVWLLILAAQFLFLVWLLNIILFRPLLKVFKERDDTVKGSLNTAKEMDKKKEEGIASLNREIAAARAQGKEAFESMRNEGLAKQKEMLGEAESSAADLLQKAREELRAEVEKARASLKTDVDKFSDEIVRKLVSA
jgi:F-type H+-transporting ATPase subunit b